MALEHAINALERAINALERAIPNCFHAIIAGIGAISRFDSVINLVY